MHPMKMFASTPSFWKDRLKASGLHLALSLFIAVSCAALVFGIWYPYPYREISGGRELFLLVVSVDVVMGPLITLAIFNRTKPWSELRRDLAIVGMLQIAALAYGLWTVSMARPVHMVFEITEFRIVHAIDVPTEMLDKTPAGVDALPLTGPTLLAVRPFANSNEEFDATMAALQGVSLASRPDLWQSYDLSVRAVIGAAKPVSQLMTKFPQQAAAIEAELRRVGRKPSYTLYLPLASRQAYFWTVFLDPVTAQVLGYFPLDPF